MTLRDSRDAIFWRTSLPTDGGVIAICGVCWGVYQLTTHVSLYISSLFSEGD
jgi:hypothetical protein